MIVNETSSGKRKGKSSVGHRVFTVIGIVLCVILIPILVINVTLIIRSYTNKDDVPSIGGIFPLIVLTDSMDPVIKSGDLIVCRQADTSSLAVGDVIAFFDPAGNGTSIVTHRIIEITEEDGVLAFRTKGDANNTEDRLAVKADKVVGTYRFRIPNVGHDALFMQTTAGLIVCVFLPMLLLIAYELIRAKKFDRKRRNDNDALLAELAALRAKQAETEKPVTGSTSGGTSQSMPTGQTDPPSDQSETVGPSDAGNPEPPDERA